MLARSVERETSSQNFGEIREAGPTAQVAAEGRELEALASKRESTALAEADIACEEYEIEIARLRPVIARVADLDGQIAAAARAAEGEDDPDGAAAAELDQLQLERKDILRRFEGDRNDDYYS